MDETAVWSDMVSATTVNKTGAKDVPLKSTGREKVRVSVCLTAKADGKKLKPFIVFAGAKRETKTLHSEYKNICSVASSTNGWMNEELTLRWIKEIIGMFSFKKRLLAWDTFEAHLMDSVKRQLKDANIGAAYIPGGCTKYIQAPDVMWTAPFKAYIGEYYDEWMANGIHEFTEAGNMKPVPCRMVVKWVIDAWKELPQDIIKKSFRCCALSLPVDGSRDNEISCFKEGKPCESGRKVLEQQMTVFLNPEDRDHDPFEVTEDDINDAVPEILLIERDDIDDVEEDIDIEVDV